MASSFIDIVFDGPPEHKAGRFVEVEDEQGQSINAGEWIQRPDGYWALRISDPPTSSIPVSKVIYFAESLKEEAVVIADDWDDVLSLLGCADENCSCHLHPPCPKGSIDNA